MRISSRVAWLVVCSALFIAPFVLAAKPARAAEPGPAWGKRGMVVTSVGPAAAAGREILGRGGTLTDVQGALDHLSVVSSRRYAHLYPERLRSILLNVGQKRQKNTHQRSSSSTRN